MDYLFDAWEIHAFCSGENRVYHGDRKYACDNIFKMMRRAIINVLLFTMICFLLLTACSEKQKALNELRDLTESMEKDGDSWNDAQWDQEGNRFFTLQSELRKYNFTNEEKKEIGTLEGRCLSALANHASDGLLNKLKGMGNELNGIINGFLNDDER